MDRLIKKIKECQNPTVAGLDPKLDFIPKFIIDEAFESKGSNLDGAAQALLMFNKGLIDALYDIVPAVKPQLAYYEMYGWQGLRAFYETVQYAKQKGMYVIADGKRNDIGTTMEAYAAAHLGEIAVGQKNFAPFGSDALTVNGYLGSDGINPLLDICKKYDKSIFVLVKTSNKSSGELQDLAFANGKSVYETMGDMVESWGENLRGSYGYSTVGAVVGATYPAQQKELRECLPHTFFLVPGYGAQGGGADDVKYAFDTNGLGAIVNSSRGIMCAYKKAGCDEKDFAAAARQEALRMKADLSF
ncbi:MAG: orotidine-5'-phosphate decarboxylase [Oscillospiraceae bacterium]|jgi:orotidine-5'-phosphate decarboxylase|nr:orotidine-5'-phosphate decarboxylase [Oscillospiraceae bacterium]